MKYNEIRRQCRAVRVGETLIGGNAPIAIQSMTNTDTADVDATLEQVKRLEAAGCDLVRVSVPTIESAVAILAIKNAGVRIPIVADIHYDYRIALRCAELGFDKNPFVIYTENGNSYQTIV